MTLFKTTLLCFTLIICLPGCSSENKQQEQLGELDFKVTGSAEAQPYFKKGLLLLHSFEYEDAAENFSKAHELDPSFAMAYWGEAMTYNHSLWRYQNKEKADSVLNLLAPSPGERILKAKTDIEKGFINAVNILYSEGGKAERDDRYATFMESLYKKYPGNAEVAAFYSISLIGSVEVGRDTTVYGQAAKIAKEVLAINPNHPGALHYLIHSYDDPDHAALALEAADAYAKVAPSASHALHMPSHIYLALGQWEKVISSNEVAWAASEERKVRKTLSNDALGYHSFHWLMYGYLQKGRKDDAKKLVTEMQQYCDTLPSSRAREHMILLKSTYLVESGDWQSSVPAIQVKTDDLNVSVRAMDHYVNGMAAYYKQDEKLLAANISDLNGECMSAHQHITDKGGHSCGSVTATAPNMLDVQYAEVMQMELEAMHAWMKKDTAVTDEWFKKATALENSISYSYGPPTVVKPSNELYGEWLLVVMKPEEAKQQFELALKAAPNRALSLNGTTASNKLLNEKKALAKK
ncbi:MAG TPA: hypothetical protein PLD84_06215 [Chitinophagales bacterium]|nr:hypothetical protein [Chitinophagales bacterium]